MYGFNYVPDNKEVDSDILKLFYVTSPPVIPAANEIIESVTLGDNTKIYRHTGNYEERTISLECSFVAESYRGWTDQISLIQSYFSGTSGKLELISDDLEHYWIVKVASVSVSNRILGRSSNFTITFICEPYRYLSSYQRPFNIVTGTEYKIYNNFMETSPIFKIKLKEVSNVQLTQIKVTVNDATFTINHNLYLINRNTYDYMLVDTEELKVELYKPNGSYDLITLDTVGDISKLKLINGINTVKVTCAVGKFSVDVFRNFKEL